MRLFHFSEDPGIALFEPRPVRTPVSRPQGQEWLNGPLVWAIDEAHDILYFFPRECPRILIWPTASTTAEDRALWFGGAHRRAIAFIEQRWAARLRAAIIHRYEFPTLCFESLGDVGMWVSRSAVRPLRADALRSLPHALEARNVELRALPALTSLRDIWTTTLHASGIRLRNAEGWGVTPEPGSRFH